MIKKVKNSVYFMIYFVDSPVLFEELKDATGSHAKALSIINAVKHLASVTSIDGEKPNVARSTLDASSITVASYDITPDHPELRWSVRHDLIIAPGRSPLYVDGKPYMGSTRNPPVLHRCELYFPPGTPEHERFAAVTAIDEAAGMFDPAVVNRIGTRKGTARVLASREHR